MQIDDRITRLAENIVVNSLKLKKGETVYIEAFSAGTRDMFEALIKAVVKAGGVPFYYFNDNAFVIDAIEGASAMQVQGWADLHKYLMQKADCYVGVRGYEDMFAFPELTLRHRICIAKFFKSRCICVSVCHTRAGVFCAIRTALWRQCRACH